MDNYFIWKGISSLEQGIYCSNPTITVPQKDIEKVKIPGRSGYLSVDNNSYNTVVKSLECRLIEYDRLDSVIEWLSGYGKAIFSDEPGRFYYAGINKAIPIEYMLKRYRAFMVSFDCQPFKYNVSAHNDTIEFIKPEIVIYGKGTYQAEPTITITGNGDIVLTLNNEIIRLKGIEGHITINSEFQDCYKGDLNQNNKMVGSFPVLKANNLANIISCSGDTEKVEIIPNWRWL